MAPLKETANPDAHLAVGQLTLDLLFRQSQDSFQNIKAMLLNYIVPALVDEKHGNSDIQIDNLLGLRGLEIMEQMVPIVHTEQLGYVIALRDGNIHSLLFSEPDKEMLSIGIRSEVDDTGQSQVLDSELHQHAFGQYLVFESTHEQKEPYLYVQGYGLATGQNNDVNKVKLWEFHHLDQIASLDEIVPYIESLLVFQQKLSETFPPASIRDFGQNT